jgi:PAS domain S-box-containing protein
LNSPKLRIYRFFFVYLALVGFVCLLSVGFLWINSELSRFKKDTDALRTSLLEDKKKMIKREVDQALNFVRHMQSKTERRLRGSAKSRVYEAYAVANNILQNERGKKSLAEIKESIRDALRPIRYNKGRGYFFAFSLDGVERLFPVNADMEGRSMLQVKGGEGESVVPDMIKLAQDQGEGFYRYTWPKPGKDGYFPKIAFVKLFEPIGWVIGTGEYLDDVRADIQEECLEWISNIKFGRDGYVFAGQWDGKSLSGPETGRNMIAVEDANGVKIVQKLIEAAKSGGGFVQYVLPQFEGKKHAAKISYAVGVPEWQWYLGSGVYLDDIETQIASEQAELDKRIGTSIRYVFLILLSLLVFIFLIVKFLSDRIAQNMRLFSGFFSNATSGTAKIELGALHFTEFVQLAESANQMVDNRRRMEQALREKEEKLSQIIMGSPVPTFVIDNHHITTHWNQALENITGISADAVIGTSKQWMAFYSAERPVMADLIVDHAGEREVLKYYHGKLQPTSGSDHTYAAEDFFQTMGEGGRWLFFTAAALRNIDGQVTGAVETLQDFTARKRAEQALRESEEKYRQLVEFANDAIFIIQDERITFHNPRTLELLGYHAQELEKLPFQELIHPKDQALVQDRYERGLSGETPTPAYSFRVVHKSGRYVNVQMNATPIIWEGQPGTLNFLRDVTSQQIVEDQLRHAQKIEAIGTLAGGIAHDFNNILAAILGYSELAMADLPPGNPIRYKLESIHKSGERARDLVTQILAFSRKDEPVMIPVAMHLIVKDALKILRPAIPTTIEINTQVNPGCDVLGDPAQLHRIIMNLCTNAYQAMAETGGVLSISLSTVTLGGKSALATIAPGSYALLVVADTGSGIAPENRDRIFDPYFTTKERGKGTGLGLATVHGIVKSHGGTIRVDSCTGRGTRFEIYLPLTQETVGTKEESQAPLAGGHEHILLVDDEPDILDIEREMLEHLGYTITTQGSAKEALTLFAAQPEIFDLVITDMTMPTLSGDKLAAELKNIRSDIPIILCTGFNELVSKEKADSLGIKGFLMKPVKMADLTAMVRDLLD